jgi:hypothetical protein
VRKTVALRCGGLVADLAIRPPYVPWDEFRKADYIDHRTARQCLSHAQVEVIWIVQGSIS